MVETSADSIIYSVYQNYLRGTNPFRPQYDDELPRIALRNSTAALFSMSLSSSYYGEDGNINNDSHVWIHFILCGGVNVWAVVTDNPTPENLELDAWENISNHDSCWRDAIRNLLSSIYFQECDFVQRMVPEAERAAPKDIHTYATLDRFGGDPFRLIHVWFDTIPGDHAYGYVIKKIEPSLFKLGVVEKEGRVSPILSGPHSDRFGKYLEKDS